MKLANKISIEVASRGNTLCATLLKITAAQILILTISLLSGPVALSNEIALVASNPSQICKSDRPDCRCPNCGSLCDSCSPSCPPVVADGAADADISIV